MKKSNNIFKNLIQAKEKINSSKKTSAEKAKETKLAVTKMIEMQRYLDNSPEKRGLFLDVIKNTLDTDTGEKILNKGIVVYVRLLDTLRTLEQDLEKEDIQYKTISGKVSTPNRAKICDWFNNDPSSKVIFITDAGSASINLHSTNHIVLYNIPNGYSKYKQILGRICRQFGIYNKYNIHTVIVEDSSDEYFEILISSKKEIENELLHCDSIQLKGTGSFNLNVLKKIRQKLLWKKK